MGQTCIFSCMIYLKDNKVLVPPEEFSHLDPVELSSGKGLLNLVHLPRYRTLTIYNVVFRAIMVDNTNTPGVNAPKEGNI